MDGLGSVFLGGGLGDAHHLRHLALDLASGSHFDHGGALVVGEVIFKFSAISPKREAWEGKGKDRWGNGG